MIAESQIASSIHLHPQERNQPLGNQSKASGLSALGSILMIPQLITIMILWWYNPERNMEPKKMGLEGFVFLSDIALFGVPASVSKLGGDRIG